MSEETEKKTCKYCGEPVGAGKMVYCSRRCQNQFYNRRSARVKALQKVKKVCPVCHEEFESGNSQQIYCKDQCRDLGRCITKTCEVCGNEFLGRRWSSYCGRACKAQAQHERAIERHEARKADKPKKVNISEMELYRKLDRVVMAAYEKGDEYEKAKIRALNPKMFAETEMEAACI
jgi:hypothetical protein